MCIFLTSSHSWEEAQCTNLFFRRPLLFSGGCSRPTKQTIYTLHVGFSDTENHPGDFIFLLVVAPALDNSVSTEKFSIAADGDASEVRTHVLRMKISYPDQLDDGAKCSGL